MSGDSRLPPGPWMRSGLTVYQGQATSENRRFRVTVEADGGIKAEAIARAIEALPKLIEALQELVERRDKASAGLGRRDGSDGRYARARLALEKAGIK